MVSSWGKYGKAPSTQAKAATVDYLGFIKDPDFDRKHPRGLKGRFSKKVQAVLPGSDWSELGVKPVTYPTISSARSQMLVAARAVDAFVTMSQDKERMMGRPVGLQHRPLTVSKDVMDILFGDLPELSGYVAAMIGAEDADAGRRAQDEFFMSEVLGVSDDESHESLRGTVKASVSDRIAALTSMSSERVSDVLGVWASTSNDSNTEAQAFQMAAANLFGVSLSEWQEDNVERLVANGETTRERLDKMAAEVEPVLSAMYLDTQRAFRAAGVKTITLYRGVAKVDCYGARIGNDVYTQSNAVESWTAMSTVAHKFIGGRYATHHPVDEHESEDMFSSGVYISGDPPGEVLAMEVPVERVLCSCRTGAGCLLESEFLVLGGPGQDRATIVAYADNGYQKWYAQDLHTVLDNVHEETMNAGEGNGYMELRINPRDFDSYKTWFSSRNFTGPNGRTADTNITYCGLFRPAKGDRESGFLMSGNFYEGTGELQRGLLDVVYECTSYPDDDPDDFHPFAVSVGSDGAPYDVVINYDDAEQSESLTAELRDSLEAFGVQKSVPLYFVDHV